MTRQLIGVGTAPMRVRPLLRIAGLLVLALAWHLGPLRTAAAASPTLTISPTEGQANVTVTVVGQGFKPDDWVYLTWDSQDGAALSPPAGQPGSIKADSSGHFRYDVTIPAKAPADGHEIISVAQGRIQATAIYVVSAAPPAGSTCTTGPLQFCLDLSGLIGSIGSAIGAFLNNALVALFGPIEHAFGDEFAAITSPFTQALTWTPDIPNEDSWLALRTFQGTLQQLAGVLFVGFLTIGVFAKYLETVGAGDFSNLTSPVRRAALVTGFIAGYQSLMSMGFHVLNGATDFIVNTPLTTGESAWQALRGALFTLTNGVSLTSIVDVLIMVIGLVLVLLCVVIRMFGLALLAGLYLVGPLALVTWLSPQFEFIARWWVRTFVSLALWPLGYALALKVIQILLASGGPLSEFSGLASSLGALGLLVGLYRVPAIVGSIAGAGGALLGRAATSATDTAVGAAVALGQAAVTKKILP